MTPTPPPLPTLGGAGAQPLRFLDFLIHAPRRAFLLHRGGYSIRIPNPERFAVHKLIVWQGRRSDDDGTAKNRKDLPQAQLIMKVIVTTRAQDDLAEVSAEALDRGPSWSREIRAAFRRLAAKSAATVQTGLMDGMKAWEIPHRNLSARDKHITPKRRLKHAKPATTPPHLFRLPESPAPAISHGIRRENAVHREHVGQ